MKLHYDFSRITAVEFGVGVDEKVDQRFYAITVDSGVQTALGEVAEATWDKMRELSDNPPKYQPSEKYDGIEYVFIPIQDDMVQRLRQLHEAQNLPLNNSVLSDPSNVFCYFARITNQQGKRLTAVRRATQFKGILKSRLLRLFTDALQLVEDSIFKLDTDFDLLIDSDNVHILRPTAFVFISEAQEHVLNAVGQNIKIIQTALPFVDFRNIRDYASQHPRAARYLASIRDQEMRNVETNALKKLCKNTGVDLQTVNGKVVVQDEHIMGFLEVLDRRRYEVTLVKNSPERFRATSREKLDN